MDPCMDRVKSTYEGLLKASYQLIEASTSTTSSQAERTRATLELEDAIRASDDACQAFQTELAAAERHIYMQKLMASKK
ncbi:hypothetical protein COCOBI_17-2130 [Coccomyxa sp. Obi]|nr:hypothetical protein COCOBI_17-2130 [Coccomyxa sp. Obi]